MYISSCITSEEQDPLTDNSAGTVLKQKVDNADPSELVDNDIDAQHKMTTMANNGAIIVTTEKQDLPTDDSVFTNKDNEELQQELDTDANPVQLVHYDAQREIANNAIIISEEQADLLRNNSVRMIEDKKQQSDSVQLVNNDALPHKIISTSAIIITIEDQETLRHKQEMDNADPFQDAPPQMENTGPAIIRPIDIKKLKTADHSAKLNVHNCDPHENAENIGPVEEVNIDIQHDMGNAENVRPNIRKAQDTPRDDSGVIDDSSDTGARPVEDDCIGDAWKTNSVSTTSEETQANVCIKNSCLHSCKRSLVDVPYAEEGTQFTECGNNLKLMF